MTEKRWAILAFVLGLIFVVGSLIVHQLMGKHVSKTTIFGGILLGFGIGRFYQMYKNKKTTVK